MRQRVQQCDPSRHRARGAAAGHVARRQELRPRRARRVIGRADAAARRQNARSMIRGETPGERDLVGRLGRAQHRAGGIDEARYHSALSAAITSATWPGTFTLRHSLRTTPLSSMRKVERSMPMYFLPYMLFSTHTP